MDTVPGAKTQKDCVVSESTISRFACRIIVERSPPHTARIYAAGFNSTNNIFLGVGIVHSCYILSLIQVYRSWNKWEFGCPSTWCTFEQKVHSIRLALNHHTAKGMTKVFFTLMQNEIMPWSTQQISFFFSSIK